MLIWHISFEGREGPLDRVHAPEIREAIGPLRDHIQGRPEPLSDEGDLTIIFAINDQRELSFTLRGDSYMVNRARDLLGDKDIIGPRRYQ